MALIVKLKNGQNNISLIECIRMILITFRGLSQFREVPLFKFMITIIDILRNLEYNKQTNMERGEVLWQMYMRL